MLVLANANIIDCTDGEVQDGVSVVLEEDRIVDVTATPSTIDKARIFDCSDCFVFPGLIDAHVHIGGVDLDSGQQHRANSVAYLAFLIAERMRIMLDCGFTTVRDAGGGDIGFKQAVERGLTPGPRLLLSMRALSQTGGHGDLRSPYEPGDYFYEGSFGMTHVIADGVDGVTRATREELRRGADVIKVIASGGAVSPGSLDSSEYTRAELSAIVEQARAAGKTVMAHALPSRAIANCVEAGVHSIEHGNFLDEPTAVSMREHGVYLVPTLLAYEHAAEHASAYGYSEEIAEKLEVGAKHGRTALEVAVRAGVKIGSGSDMIGPAVDVMGEEIAAQGEVMGPVDALLAATRVNSELCGMGDKVGTIEVGKKADLVVTRSNPLDDLRILGSADGLVAVIKDGVVVRSDLPERG